MYAVDSWRYKPVTLNYFDTEENPTMRLVFCMISDSLKFIRDGHRIATSSESVSHASSASGLIAVPFTSCLSHLTLRRPAFPACHVSECAISASQVGDQIVEINGEATQGITHTRAIELIQAGGNKVHLLLRPGQGLVPDHSERLPRHACVPAHCCHCTYIFRLVYEAYTYIEAFVWICLSFFIPMHVLLLS